MNISLIGTVWAAIKGAFSFGTTARLSIVDYTLEATNNYIASVDKIMANIAKFYSLLVTVCDKLDYYRKFIPTPWITYYDNICLALGSLRDMLADGKFEREELENVIENVKTAIAAWRK